MLQNREKNFVSCVVYLHNEGRRVRDFLQVVCGHILPGAFRPVHAGIAVAQPPPPAAFPFHIEQIKGFLAEETHKPVVSLINLSYYQGVESAMNAGRDLAVGDFLFEFDVIPLLPTPASSGQRFIVIADGI